ncbi:peptide deformylase [bacterium]
MKTILEIKFYPDEVLRLEASNVEKITQKEKKLFENMLHTMYANKGIGLAAPQVGISLKLIVVDVGNGAVKLANPKVISCNGGSFFEEGCLSLPGEQVKVMRPDKVVVEAMDEHSKTIRISAEGLLARALLHEIDHLNGKLIIDHEKGL